MANSKLKLHFSKKEKKPTDKLADKTAFTKFLQGIFGDAQKKTLRRLHKKALEIGKLEPKYEAMSDDELKATVNSFIERLAIAPIKSSQQTDENEPSKRNSSKNPKKPSKTSIKLKKS